MAAGEAEILAGDTAANTLPVETHLWFRASEPAHRGGRQTQGGGLARMTLRTGAGSPHLPPASTRAQTSPRVSNREKQTVTCPLPGSW